MPVTHPHTFVICWGFPSVLQRAVLFLFSMMPHNEEEISLTCQEHLFCLQSATVGLNKSTCMNSSDYSVKYASLHIYLQVCYCPCWVFLDPSGIPHSPLWSQLAFPTGMNNNRKSLFGCSL